MCTLKISSRMMPSQKPGIAKLSVKKTREIWSTTPLDRTPAMKPTGNEISAASTALKQTRYSVGAMCETITVVAFSS